MKRTKKKTRAWRPGDKPEPTTLSRADKLKLWGMVSGFAVVTLLMFHFIGIAKQRASVAEAVAGWQRDYHLTDEQARRLRAMEEEFHGSGDPFLRPAHTPAETSEHHRQMSAVVGPDDSERFFAMLEGHRGKLQPQR